MKTFQITRPNGEKYTWVVKAEDIDLAMQYWDTYGCEYTILNVSDISPQPSSCS